MNGSDGAWNGVRVLITGHSGFKGGWLSLMLRQRGAQVAGLSLPPSTNPSLFDTARIGEIVDSHFGDIRSAELVRRTMAAVAPEVVFHMAAQALVRRSYAEPLETFATNVLGTAHVLEAARHTSSVRAVVNVTSDKCYENRDVMRHYREDDPMGGADPYSSSKGCAELIARAYSKSYFGGAKVASVRAGNVVGGGDWSEDRLVPDCIRSFSRCEPVRLRNPSAIRPWQHVLEPLSGYLLVAEALLSGRTLDPGYNFGPALKETRPVEEVVRAVARRRGNGAGWESDPRPSPPEARILSLDSTLAHTSLGWRTRLSFEECVDWTVEWYQRHLAGGDMRLFTSSQIEQYQSR